MPQTRAQATPPRKHVLPPETSAEREAKRRHVETFESLEESTWDVKDEPSADENIPDATPSILQRGIALANSNAGNVVPRIDIDCLKFSLTLLASNAPTANPGYDKMISGAAEGVFAQYLKDTNDRSPAEMPKPGLDSWLRNLLLSKSLPVDDSPHRVSFALREMMAKHAFVSWASEYDTSNIPATIAMLQKVQEFGTFVVSDLIRLLQESYEHQDAVTALTENVTRAAGGEKERRIGKKARSESPATPKSSRIKEATERPLKVNKFDAPAKDAGEKCNRAKVRRSKNVAPATRCETEPPLGSENLLCENFRHRPALPSSSLALAEFKERGAAMGIQDSGPSHSSDTSVSKVFRGTPAAQSSPMKTIASPSTKVRFVSPGKSSKSNLLIFFIGPSMSSADHKDIDAACFESFALKPFQSHFWSESVWVAELKDLPGIFSDIITLQGTQIIAEPSDSHPQHYFVACQNGAQVTDEVLKEAVDQRLHNIFPKQSPGRVQIYRTAHNEKRPGGYVFLSLSEVSQSSLFKIPVIDESGQGRHLLFKPVIMDFQKPCFYCEKVHEDLICPDVVQLSKFEPTKSTKA